MGTFLSTSHPHHRRGPSHLFALWQLPPPWSKIVKALYSKLMQGSKYPTKSKHVQADAFYLRETSGCLLFLLLCFAKLQQKEKQKNQHFISLFFGFSRHMARSNSTSLLRCSGCTNEATQLSSGLSKGCRSWSQGKWGSRIGIVMRIQNRYLKSTHIILKRITLFKSTFLVSTLKSKLNLWFHSFLEIWSAS